jgi:hypothetical protein
MALDVDGYAVLGTIGSRPDIFPAIARDAAKAARTLVVKQIAHRTTGLQTVRDIRTTLGPHAFSLIVDGMSDAQIKSLVLKLDKYAPEEEVADGAARRHVLKLAEGAAQPSERSATRLSRPRRTVPPAPPPRISYASAGATRKR